MGGMYGEYMMGLGCTYWFLVGNRGTLLVCNPCIIDSLIPLLRMGFKVEGFKA